MESIELDSVSKNPLDISTQKESISKNRNFKDKKGKQGIDAASCGESLMTNSESLYNSSTSFIKSPSRLDSLSIFESSPNLKRVKVSEEEEKAPSNIENFHLGESILNQSSKNPPLRKSKRKKKKSKILREATGEDDEEVIIPAMKRTKVTKKDNEIGKIMELSKAAQKREESIHISKSGNFLVEYEYDYGGDDPTPV